MSTMAAPSTKDKRKAPVTRQQSTATKAGDARPSSHPEHQKTSVDITLEEEENGEEKENNEEEEDNEEDEDNEEEEEDEPSTHVVPVSDQHDEALRDHPVLVNILAELHQCQQDLAAL